MEEKQKVYIKGVPGRGDEVIKALEDLEGFDYYRYDGGNERDLFFIDHDGRIDYQNLNTETAKIIMESYREIKLPEKWKAGDILFREKDDEFAVVKYKSDVSPGEFCCHIVTCFGVYQGSVSIEDDFRLATDSDMIRFHERLHFLGTEWNAEEQVFVDWKWRPKEYYDIACRRVEQERANLTLF